MITIYKTTTAHILEAECTKQEDADQLPMIAFGLATVEPKKVGAFRHQVLTLKTTQAHVVPHWKRSLRARVQSWNERQK